MDNERTTVKDYMTKNVITVKYDTLNKDVIQLMKETKHDGYPVVDEEGHIVGIITAYDLLLKDWVSDHVSGIMSKEVIVAREDMHINDASRVMFRHGISRLPVVDKERHVKGIMTNTDIVRSHIERSTPTKVSAFRETMEKLYDIKTTLTREPVPVEKIKPTQDRVYLTQHIPFLKLLFQPLIFTAKTFQFTQIIVTLMVAAFVFQSGFTIFTVLLNPGIDLTVRYIIFRRSSLIIIIATDTIVNNFLALIQRCLSACFCHIDLPFRFVIHEFHIGIILHYPTPE